MATNPHREHPNTYFVQDRNNNEEITRLGIQDQMITTVMGGALAEQTERAQLESILDVGCGTGGWLIKASKENPGMTRLVGVDVNSKLIEYAQRQAEDQQVGDRVQFRTMDMLRRLDFLDNTFDLINQRFGNSYLRTWDWPNVLREFQRVSKPGGIVRLTEADIVIESNSSALTRLFNMSIEAAYLSGHIFSQTSDGMVSHLARLLEQYGYEEVQTRVYQLEYPAGTPEVRQLYENMKYFFHTIVPFLRKWIRVPNDYEEIYQQMLSEMQQPDFAAREWLLTAWGKTHISLPPELR